MDFIGDLWLYLGFLTSAMATPEELQKLVVCRRQRKAAITRHIGNLCRFMAEGNVAKVEEKLSKMRETFDSMESAHMEIVDNLVNESDLDKHEKWMCEIETEYIEAITNARAWAKAQASAPGVPDVKVDVKPAVATNGASTCDNSDSLSDLVNLLSIPKVELDSYDGDPREYQAFISMFDELVDSKLKDDQLKLSRLLQYTTGTAKSAIKSCSLIGGSDGYAQARAILKSRFGNTHLVTQTIIADLRNGKRVTKPHELLQLADDLSTASAALRQLDKLSEVDTQQMIKDVLSRCQQYVLNKWRRKALDFKRDNDMYPGFDKFVEFVRQLASEASDPVYGSQQGSSGKGVSYYTMTKTRAVTSSMAPPQKSTSGMKSSGGSCVLCNGNHEWFTCETFLEMSTRVRRDAVFKHRLCFNCLQQGHRCTECPQETVCSVPGCGKKHHKFLHTKDNNYVPLGPQHTASTGESGNVVVGNVYTYTTGATGPDIYLPTVQVVVDGKFTAHALLDTGSTNTFVSEKLMAKLDRDISHTHYKMNTLSGSTDDSAKMTPNIDITSLDGTHGSLKNVMVWPSIPARYPAHEVDFRRYSHLADLPLHPVCGQSDVDLLIGMDHADILMPLEVRCGSDRKQPYATRTVLGWSLNGPLNSQTGSSGVVNFVDLERLDHQVERLWSLESHDTDEVESLSFEDRHVLDLWSHEMRHIDGHYELPVPWKQGRPSFVDNKYMASVRLNSLVKKLHRDDTMTKYDDNINKLLTDGYAEPVPLHEDSEPGSVWYLPHHWVTSEAKPGKLRVVFDCAATQAGMSLNNQCLQGPDLNNKLLHVLLRFRQFHYAIMADVESMYHQVRIPLKDRNCLRFLWDVNGQNQEFRMTSHLFGGVWCAASSTYALRQTVVDFPSSQLVNYTVLHWFYVDDLLKSVRTYSEAVEVIQGTKELLKSGGFNLTKFVVSDTRLFDLIVETDRAKEVKVISSEMLSKALGIKWNVSDDAFYYVSRDHDSPSVVTRRSMLSKVSSMYDPLGLICPVILQGKALFQEATRMKLAWDDGVPSELSHRWSQWLSSLSQLTSLSFPRCIIPKEFADGVMELHHFCDASVRGFGACSYLRIVDHRGQIHVSLVAGKARLAPMKQASIPRLELLAATVAAKLDKVISRELEIPLLKSTFWSDSQIVLAYIRSETRRFKTFVANRVVKIRSQSSPDQWYHISGGNNPADILSRGCSPTDIPEMWFTGPGFLSTHKSDWPSSEVMPESDPLEGDPETKTISTGDSVLCTHGEVVSETCHPLDDLIDHFSSFYKMKKALSWLLRVKQRLLGFTPDFPDYITVAELKNAEHLLLKHVQERSYPSEIAALRSGRSVPKSSSICSLDPMLINDLLVVGGRVGRLKSSVILPRHHRLSEVIVLEYHSSSHLGTEWLLSLLRERFWIIRARSLIKKIKRRCCVCRRLYGSPMFQKMANLPPERCLPDHPPFTNTGVDLFGPLHVKLGRSDVKRYGCVYTCFTTRAIHLEVLNSLEADSFINGFLRFISRRGRPSKIWSDNGTNLVGA